MKHVSAAEANRNFSRLLREVSAGETVTITSHGRPIAKLVPPADDEALLQERVAAGRRLLERLRHQAPWPAISWTREELYEDEPYPETFR
jgi:prevent-host-death family protein